MNILDTLKEQLGKPFEDLEFLLNCLKQVLTESGEEELIHYIPWLSDTREIPMDEFSEKVIQLYSIAFHFLNLVEVNSASSNRKRIEDQESLSDVNGLWGQRLKALKLLGISERVIAEAMPGINVEPVLTAHPTEAKRATVLHHHRQLYLAMLKRENYISTKLEQKANCDEIKRILYRLWKTGEIYLEKPDIESELKNITHYLVNIFPEVLPYLDIRFINAWEEAGFDPKIIRENDLYPKVSFGNWVGGDRDGHPLVTAEVTKETLKKFRLNALVVIRKELIELIKNLSFTGNVDDCYSREFRFRFNELLKEIGQEAEHVLHRNKDEVFRQYTGMLICKISLDVRHSPAAKLQEKPYSYVYPQELRKDLEILRQELIFYKADCIAYNDITKVIRIVDTFGFHLAKLDIRQNSKFHEFGIKEYMDAASLDGEGFLKANEKDRLAFINKELISMRPFFNSKSVLGDHAKNLYDCYNVLYEHVNQYGSDAIGGLIVSMTRTVSDLLVVYLLAREVGLIRVINNEPVCLLPVVPLFETIDDLESGHKILEDFLKHPITVSSLKYSQKLKGLPQPVMQVMVGYSDSNKDGGILASLWGLYEAQSRLYKAGEKHGVKIVFFHGKGGSISRGAGPVHFFIDSLPHSSLNGFIRITEQGETVAQKYDYMINAAYNIELLVAGAAYKTIINHFTPYNPHFLEETLSKLAKKSREYYSRLLSHPKFIPFFSEATPIDAIECCKIGSRPSRRSGKRSLEDLRAIPWVFSWNQSRFNITSWYGIGSTFEEFMESDPEGFARFKTNATVDPFIIYILTRIDTSVSSADDEIILEYASLVTDEDTRNEILFMILQELAKTKKMLNIIIEKPLEERRKAYYYSNLMRKTALCNLHKKQIVLLKKWRQEKLEGDIKKAEKTLTVILLTINAIAGAIRNTG